MASCTALGGFVSIYMYVQGIEEVLYIWRDLSFFCEVPSTRVWFAGASGLGTDLCNLAALGG